jgi:hypothetical protein
MSNAGNVGIAVAGRGPMEPPLWEIPGLVPRCPIIARTADRVIALGPIEVYLECVMMDLRVLLRPGSAAAGEELDLREALSHTVSGDGWPAFSVSVSDPETGDATSLHLDLRGGGSHRSSWHATYLAWPVPIGDLSIRAFWTPHGLDGTALVTASELRAARDSVQRLDPA